MFAEGKVTSTPYTDPIHEIFEGSDGRPYPYWVNVAIDVSVKHVQHGVPLADISCRREEPSAFGATTRCATVATEGARRGRAAALGKGSLDHVRRSSFVGHWKIVFCGRGPGAEVPSAYWRET